VLTVGKHEVSYDRVSRDFYPTPPWPTQALTSYVPVAGKRVWEPAAGRGDMATALEAAGASVYATDIEDRGYTKLDRVLDFLDQPPVDLRFGAIITNPPYGARNTLAVKFVELSLERIGDSGLVAMLLPSDFDAAAGRRSLFKDCPAFAAKIVLTKRIVWFTREQGGESPKENHAWFVWRRPARAGRPIILYAPINPELPAVTRPTAEERADLVQEAGPNHQVAVE
jgi:hypothetical protein